jgi:pseudouridine synthase
MTADTSSAAHPGNGSAGIRLQKLISMAGAASRRAAEALIQEGRVEVNGEVIRTAGAKADPDRDVVKVDGRRLRFDVRPRYILLHKPRGYVTTRRDPQGRRTVMDLLHGVREYVYPVGRLDYESEGLLLLTSDGDLAAHLTHPRHGVERVYEAIVSGVPDARALEALRHGVIIDGRPTAPTEVRVAGTVQRGRRPTTQLLLTLREGRNRQVRKMCAAVGHPVQRLVRVRIGPIELTDLPAGRWRDLTPAEIASLKGRAR